MLEKNDYFYKANLLEKHFLRKIVKKEIDEQLFLKNKNTFIQKAWLKLITTLIILQEIKSKKEVI